MAVIIQDVPPGYDWGWYSREDPRMHVQTVDEEHFKLHKVWLERDGKRVFEPAEIIRQGKKVPLPRKVGNQLREVVEANREDLEARWVRLMIAKKWLCIHISGPIVALTVYPNSPNRFARTVDLSQELPGLYDANYAVSPRPVKPEDIVLSDRMAALELWPKENIADRHHIFLPPIIWRD